jgi:hypothetical protein
MLSKMGTLVYVAECDECEHEVTTDSEDIRDAAAEIKRLGWTIRKEAGEFVHRCPSCS